MGKIKITSAKPDSVKEYKLNDEKESKPKEVRVNNFLLLDRLARIVPFINLLGIVIILLKLSHII